MAIDNINFEKVSFVDLKPLWDCFTNPPDPSNNFPSQVQLVSYNSTEIMVRDENEEDIPMWVFFIGYATAFDMALNDAKVTTAVAEKIGPWAVAAVEWVKSLGDKIRCIIKYISELIYNEIFQLDEIQLLANKIIRGGIAKLVVSWVLP